VIVDPTVTAVANIVATKVPVPLGLTEPAPAAPVVRAVAEPPPAAPALIGTTLLQINNFVGPSAIATPYGIAEHDTVGSYTGNHKKRHSPVERNRAHADFRPGLRMQVIDGGIRMPADAAP
jgi:hypothetical protein